MLLAKSTLDLARENLKSFSEVVDVNRQRVQRGRPAEGEFYKISLQKLQFEQDVSAAEVGARAGQGGVCGSCGIRNAWPTTSTSIGDLAFDDARRVDARRL